MSEALAAGADAQARALEAACRHKPSFAGRARDFILRMLADVGQASGEDLTDAAKSAGIVPTDDRAFGGVFGGLVRQGLIQSDGQVLSRRKGHATAGARMWSIQKPPKSEHF